MTDWNIATPPELSPAEKAVLYMLERIQRDPDLRYLFANTEAFALLVGAEAQRSKKDRAEVEQHYLTPPPHLAKRPSRLPVFKVLMYAVEDFLGLWPLSGYELEAYCSETLVPDLKAALAKATGAA